MEYKPIFPKSRYKGKESDLQKIIFTFLSNYPDIFAFHVKNEGIVSKGFQGVKYGGKKKAEGVVSGIPDILIIEKNYEKQIYNTCNNSVICFTDKIYHGMAIELKAGYGQLKDTQLNCLEKFEERGWYTCVCWSFDDFEYHFNQYF